MDTKHRCKIIIEQNKKNQPADETNDNIHWRHTKNIKIYSWWCDVMCDAYLMCIKAQPYRYGFYMHAANDYATRLHACLPKFVYVLVFIPVHLWFDCMRFFLKI